MPSLAELFNSSSFDGVITDVSNPNSREESITSGFRKPVYRRSSMDGGTDWIPGRGVPEVGRSGVGEYSIEETKYRAVDGFNPESRFEVTLPAELVNVQRQDPSTIQPSKMTFTTQWSKDRTKVISHSDIQTTGTFPAAQVVGIVNNGSTQQLAARRK